LTPLTPGDYDQWVDRDHLGKTAIAFPSERPTGKGQPSLVVIAGPGIGQHHDLGDEVLDIGRQEECTISVASTKVSRRHAAIQKILGRYTVADLGSTNGTFVNGIKLETAHKLEDGDKIKVGELVLKYMESRLELQYHQQILEMATTDALTGAQNKRAFDEALGTMAIKSASEGVPLGIVIFDVDHFKKINDTHGHSAGDTVLRELSALALDLCKEHRLFRVGGEEFCVLLSEADLDTSTAFAETLRRAVEAKTFQHESTPIAVTISAGAAVLAADESTKALYQRADEKLYASKHDGRNRVTS
jgi:diguanylate cyclase (GGDEF)-like protein